MNNETYEELFAGYEIKHAAIASKRMMVFVAHKSVPVTESHQPADELPTRFITYVPDILTEREGFGYAHFEFGLRSAHIVMHDRLIAAEQFGRVWESKTDDSWYQVTQHREKMRFLRGIKVIDGAVFACGNPRKIYQRIDFQNWVDITDDKQHSYLYDDLNERRERGVTNHIGYPVGFTCFDGFSKQEIYAGGLYGTCWRYDDKRWYRVNLNTRWDIADIVCANETVFICFTNGRIVQGRHDQWRALDTKVADDYTFAADVKAAAWFRGKLYLGTPFALYVLEGEKLNMYQFPEGGPTQSSFASVAACDEALLSYGDHQALIYDGKKWQEIFNRPAFDQSNL